MPTTTKECCTCHRPLPADLDHFYACKATKDGLNPKCRDCFRDYYRDYRDANKEQEAERKRRWRKGETRKGLVPLRPRPKHGGHRRSTCRRRRTQIELCQDPVLRLSMQAADRCRRNARLSPHRRHVYLYSVTAAHLADLWHRQGGRDFYTRLPLAMDLPAGHPEQPSIDRIDSGQGYVPGNVCWVAAWVNRAKGTMPPDQFRALLARLK
jgi:hypothetical protein